MAWLRPATRRWVGKVVGIDDVDIGRERVHDPVDIDTSTMPPGCMKRPSRPASRRTSSDRGEA